MSNTITTKEFIARAKKIHNGRFSYKNTVYSGMTSKLTVTCPVHGDIEIRAGQHLKGSECFQCSRARRRLTTESFIEKAKVVHGSRYKYHKVIIENDPKAPCGSRKVYVDIWCKEHGLFNISTNNHLNGKGCPTCAGNQRMTLEEFVAKAKKMYKNSFDYKKVCSYTNANTKVKIYCKTHDIYFLQSPYNHLRGAAGCPECRVEKTVEGQRQNGGVSNGYIWKKVTLPDGRIVKVQGYEPWGIDKILATVASRKLRFGSDVAKIKYQHGDKMKTYFPDFQYGKVLVEIKSVWTWKRTREMNVAKLRAARAAGYKTRLIIFNDKGECVKDVLKYPKGE